MIRLSAEAEPEIFATTKRFGTVLENVVIDPVTRELDLDDPTLAENSRGAYPIDFIPNSSEDEHGPAAEECGDADRRRVRRAAADRAG